MPGEKEYMAGKLQLIVPEFADRYLDILEMSDGTQLDVLKFVDSCPFLNKRSFECECRPFKVILCEIYPVVFSVEESRVDFFIDDWCPLSDTLRFRRHYIDVGIPTIRELPIPLTWFKYVATYDHLSFDYESIRKNRHHLDRCEVFTIGKLLCFQRKDTQNQPRERWHPYPEDSSLIKHSQRNDQETQLKNL